MHRAGSHLASEVVLVEFTKPKRHGYSLYLILPYLLWQDIKILKGNAVMGLLTLNAKKYAPTAELYAGADRDTETDKALDAL